MLKILLLIFSPFACKAFSPITEKVVPQMFRNNSAKQGLIFPEKHPYFSKVPREVKDEVLRQAMEAKKEGEEMEKKEYNQWFKEELNRLRQELQGKEVKNPHFEKPIIITLRGLKKALWQPHKYLAEKNAILANILTELPKAKYIKTIKSYKQEHKNEVKYHYLELKKNDKMFYINIEEHTATQKLILYTIKDKIKKQNSLHAN